jgi:hypothetical protein
MRLLAGVAFALYLAAGVLVHGDYGVGWDEEINRDVGRRTYELVTTKLSGQSASWAELSRGLVAEFGPFFETLLYAVEKGLGLEDTADVYRTRHLVTFLAFWLGTVAFFAFLGARFGDLRLALAGTALLVLSPRLFAHSFYNSKDAVLAALFMGGMLTMLRFARDPSWAWAAAHAAVCAAAVSIRIHSLLLVGVTLGLVALRLAGRSRAERETGRAAVLTAGFLAMLAAFTVLFWPQLWDDPSRTLTRALRGAGGAKQPGNAFALYLGSFRPVDALPWHYLPVWMSITIAPVVLALFSYGFAASLVRLVRRPPLDWENAQTLAVLALFAVPVVFVVAMRPLQYDEWRHLYFVYPAIVAIAVSGLAELGKTSRWLGAALVAAGIVHGLVTITRYHPYENVYFNALAGDDVESRFELDYWGLSFREGLEHVLAADPSQTVRISVSDYPGRLNALILPKEQRERLRFGKVADSDWFLSNHRQPPHFEDFRARRFPCEHEAWAVRRRDATLLGVYDLRKPK